MTDLSGVLLELETDLSGVQLNVHSLLSLVPRLYSLAKKTSETVSVNDLGRAIVNRYAAEDDKEKLNKLISKTFPGIVAGLENVVSGKVTLSVAVAVAGVTELVSNVVKSEDVLDMVKEKVGEIVASVKSDGVMSTLSTIKEELTSLPVLTDVFPLSKRRSLFFCCF